LTTYATAERKPLLLFGWKSEADRSAWAKSRDCPACPAVSGSTCLGPAFGYSCTWGDFHVARMAPPGAVMRHG
jgi:hypothetical protein